MCLSPLSSAVDLWSFLAQQRGMLGTVEDPIDVDEDLSDILTQPYEKVEDIGSVDSNTCSGYCWKWNSMRPKCGDGRKTAEAQYDEVCGHAGHPTLHKRKTYDRHFLIGEQG